MPKGVLFFKCLNSYFELISQPKSVYSALDRILRTKTIKAVQKDVEEKVQSQEENL